MVEEKEAEIDYEPVPAKEEPEISANAELKDKLGLVDDFPMATESALYNEKNGIGVMILKMEHAPIKPFSRVRVILYSDDKPLLNVLLFFALHCYF